MVRIEARALVVEDDRSWQAILREILADGRLAVAVAEELQAAEVALQAASHRLAVVDLALRGGDHHNQDGLAVLDAIRRRDPGCVAILLTGFATVELAVRALTEHGAYTCIRKEAFFSLIQKSTINAILLVEVRGAGSMSKSCLIQANLKRVQARFCRFLSLGIAKTTDLPFP